MSDSRNWLDQTRSLMALRYGREPTEDDVLAHFTLCGPGQRINIQHAMDGESQGEISLEEGEMRRAVDRGVIRQRMGEVHLALLKAGR
jgi:hypothetical protein